MIKNVVGRIRKGHNMANGKGEEEVKSDIAAAFDGGSSAIGEAITGAAKSALSGAAKIAGGLVDEAGYSLMQSGLRTAYGKSTSEAEKEEIKNRFEYNRAQWLKLHPNTSTGDPLQESAPAAAPAEQPADNPYAALNKAGGHKGSDS